ncbi:MAG: glycosyltransferase [Rhodospirillaceae bacterium]
MTPIEAMPAGLPCVVTDWNGYRDTVRDGEDGFAIPTWLPLAGSGGDLALQNDRLVTDAERDRNYNHYTGVVSQCTAVDVAKTAEAFTVLVENEGRRQGMGASGRQHAQRTFDWRIVVAAYQDLWRELSHIRARTQEVAPITEGRPAHPLRDDPFALFASYATHTVDGEAVVGLTPSETPPVECLKALRAQPMNEFAAGRMLPDATVEDLLKLLADGTQRDVFAFAELLPETQRQSAPHARLVGEARHRHAGGDGGGRRRADPFAGRRFRRQGDPPGRPRPGGVRTRRVVGGRRLFRPGAEGRSGRRPRQHRTG